MVVVITVVLSPRPPEMLNEASSAEIPGQQGDEQEAAKYPSRGYYSVALFSGDFGEYRDDVRASELYSGCPRMSPNCSRSPITTISGVKVASAIATNTMKSVVCGTDRISPSLSRIALSTAATKFASVCRRT